MNCVYSKSCFITLQKAVLCLETTYAPVYVFCVRNVPSVAYVRTYVYTPRNSGLTKAHERSFMVQSALELTRYSRIYCDNSERGL